MIIHAGLPHSLHSRNIGDPSTVNYLGDLVTHKDLKVREETLQILNKFGENGKNLMQQFLLDSASAIRSKAALLLARNAKGESVKTPPRDHPLRGFFQTGL